LKVDPGQFALVTPQGIKNCNVLNKMTLATGLLSLVNLSEKVCSTISGCRLPDSATKENSCPDNSRSQIPQTVEAFMQEINESLEKLRSKETSKGVEAMFKSIEEQLKNLQMSVSQLQRPRSKSDASTPDFLPVPVPKFPVHLDSNLYPPQSNNTSGLSNEPMPCTSSYIDNFIDEQFSGELIEFLDGHADEFEKNSERGHGVISFGQPYKYKGAKASSPLSKTFPEQIVKLVDIVQNKYPDSAVNQCLINRYEDENSLLPEHADDEETIVHGSNIFTISLGDTYDVKFKRVDGAKEEIVKPVIGRSMYVMSRSSQTQWTHRIDPSPTSRGLRYSITFRYVSKNGSEATLIQGDSNTRYLKFGSGKGTFGDRLPGRRKLCFTIDEIDPNACIGYKNVVLHCGINDIRRPQADVRDCATRLIGKLDKISKTCRSSCKIIFSPILPTKLPHLNQKAKMFNQLIFDYINRVNPRIGCLDFNCFLDDSDLLADRFGRFHDKTDAIHLGSTGIFTLSRVIIEKIRGNLVDGRMFNDVVSSNIPSSRRYSSGGND
jgi:alkylated DNA repair dioxygenase AlkB